MQRLSRCRSCRGRELVSCNLQWSRHQNETENQASHFLGRGRAQNDREVQVQTRSEQPRRSLHPPSTEVRIVHARIIRVPVMTQSQAVMDCL
jgi:hypothetical protein